jgi:hypothetical protein
MNFFKIIFNDLVHTAEKTKRISFTMIPSNFKEPEVSSPCSQEPSTGPCPEPVRSSPYHPILSLQDPFTIINWLMLFKEIIAAYCKNLKKPIKTSLG